LLCSSTTSLIVISTLFILLALSPHHCYCTWRISSSAVFRICSYTVEGKFHNEVSAHKQYTVLTHVQRFCVSSICSEILHPPWTNATLRQYYYVMQQSSTWTLPVRYRGCVYMFPQIIHVAGWVEVVWLNFVLHKAKTRDQNICTKWQLPNQWSMMHVRIVNMYLHAVYFSDIMLGITISYWTEKIKMYVFILQN